MSALALLLLLGLVVLIWQGSLRSRDLAILVAKQSCQREGLQFLDGSVALGRIRPFFTASEGPGLQRTYTFDYSSDGFGRRTGCVILRNSQPDTILLHDADH